MPITLYLLQSVTKNTLNFNTKTDCTNILFYLMDFLQGLENLLKLSRSPSWGERFYDYKYNIQSKTTLAVQENTNETDQPMQEVEPSISTHNTYSP